MMVWWILWAAFQSGIVILYHNLSTAATGQPQSESLSSSVWYAALVPAAISAVIRWLVLPRIRIAQTALVVFIIGIATAEMTCFLGLFIFPAHQQELFQVSLLGIFQFLPYYVRRYFPPDDQEMNS